MSLYLEFDKKFKILRAKATRSLDLNEYRKTIEQITSGLDYPEKVPTIWDLREFDFVDLDQQLVENTAAIREAFKRRKGAKIAYVVSDPLGYGMTRMFVAMTRTDDESLVSYNYEEAEIWIKNIAKQTLGINT